MKIVFQHITSITLKTGLFLALLLGGFGMAWGQTTMARFQLNGNLNVTNNNTVGTPSAVQNSLTWSTNNVCEGSGHLYADNNNDYLDIIINTTGYRNISVAWTQRRHTSGSGDNRWNLLADYNNDGTNDFSVTNNPNTSTSCNTITINLSTDFADQTITKIRLQRAGTGTRVIYLDNIYIQGDVIPQYQAEFISMNIGSAQWCAGETRTVSVTVKNVGQATWNTDFTTNIGVKWNTSGNSWPDYLVRTSAGNLAPGETGTFYLDIPAVKSDNYTLLNTPLDPGVNNLTFDVVNEGSCWFGNNDGSCGPGNSVFTSANLTINALPANPGNPTSNSPQCTDNGVTLNRSGTPPSGVTWFWQTSADGTSTANSGATYTVYESGTYYLRARNNTTQCWSSGAGSIAVTVNPLPTASITGNSGPICAGSNALFTLTGTSGATVTYNINDGENTTAVLTGGTATVTITGATANQTLNLVSVADANCSQTLSGSSTVTVNSLPTFTYSSTNITCFGAGNGTITFTANGGSGGLEYSINGGDDWIGTHIFENLGPNTTFTLLVKDSNGCVQTICN